MPYSEIIAVCTEIHTKNINTLRGQKVELLNVKNLLEHKLILGIYRVFELVLSNCMTAYCVLWPDEGNKHFPKLFVMKEMTIFVTIQNVKVLLMH